MQFHIQVLGMDILGDFKDHDTYIGVFLGFKNLDWHLEFTQSSDIANHRSYPDDLIVLYLPSHLLIALIKQKAIQEEIHWVKPKNPYWQKNGIQFNDPDGYGIILTYKEVLLTSDDPSTMLLKSQKIDTWNKLLQHIKALPYKRNDS